MGNEVKSPARRGFTDDELSGYDPGLCVNCDAVLADDNQGLYCSALCREKAKFVRYARGCLRDGRARKDPDIELFSSFDLAGLKDVDGFGELPGLPRAAAELAQDAPGFQLGVGTLAGRS